MVISRKEKSYHNKEDKLIGLNGMEILLVTRNRKMNEGCCWIRDW